MGHHYKQLTQEERYQIAAFKGLGISQAEIARRLHRSASTISRELKRNRKDSKYDGAKAQRLTDKRRREAAKHHKRVPALIEWVEARLREQLSPEQIAGTLKRLGRPFVSHEWIYRHVERDYRAGGELHLHLRHRRKRYRKRYGSAARTSRIPNRVGIERRPAVVDERSRPGDWEGDTVVGKTASALVTLVERTSGLVVIRKVPHARAGVTAKTIVSALAPWNPRTLTLDNGPEFAQHESIKEQLNCDVYFARPYHSWERGSNENTNGLIRQYFPKGTDFDQVTDAQVQEVEDKLNIRPRKRLEFRAPIEVLRPPKRRKVGVALIA